MYVVAIYLKKQNPFENNYCLEVIALRILGPIEGHRGRSRMAQEVKLKLHLTF